MINEPEIEKALEKNDWEKIGRIADFLALQQRMSIEEIMELFRRLGGDVESIRREFCVS